MIEIFQLVKNIAIKKIERLVHMIVNRSFHRTVESRRLGQSVSVAATRTT